MDERTRANVEFVYKLIEDLKEDAIKAKAKEEAEELPNSYPETTYLQGQIRAYGLALEAIKSGILQRKD